MSMSVGLIEHQAVIALAGQPNTGKSTVFNALTGARQHVGNWPGKTVEQKSGSYTHLNYEYQVMDLPGTYSLTANSPEEIIARDYMLSGSPTALLVMIDASQLERSLYFLSEIAGLSLPTIVALNMMDVAKAKGIHIDVKALERLLDVPVVEMVASKEIGFDKLKNTVNEVVKAKSSISSEGLFEIYKNSDGKKYNKILDLCYAEFASVGYGDYSTEWLAIKFLEGDALVREAVKSQLEVSKFKQLCAVLEEVSTDRMTFATYRFKWIEALMSRIVTVNKQKENILKRSWFDRLSTHKYFGQPLAILNLLLGFILSMMICMPIIALLSGNIVPKIYGTIMAGLETGNVPIWLLSLIGEAILPGTITAISMVLFVTVVLFIFCVMEDVGYLARVAFVFDRSMCKLGLHGKAIIPFMMSLGCNMAGITGARVIDSLKQRRLSIAISLVVPCLAMWGVISFVSTIFFGVYTPLVILGLFTLTILHMKLTALFFGKKVIGMDQEFQGLVMELPPFHKPNWKSIFKVTGHNVKNVIKKAFLLIIGISIVMWFLSFSATGHVEDSLIYIVGKAIEPISMIFGLDWR